MKPLTKLIELLADQPKGRLPQELADSVISKLADNWDQLDGSDATSMRADKLNGRASGLTWDPTEFLIEFEIERHGGIVMGSSRAERQGWRINLKNATARNLALGYKQLRKQAARLDVGPIVTKVVEAVRMGPHHDYNGSIKWVGADEIRILPGQLVPDYGVPKQTLQSRRKRLRLALCTALSKIGWRQISVGRYHCFERVKVQPNSNA